MSRELRFWKYHGTGNDFILTTEELSVAQVTQLCDRHTGVGADGVIRTCVGGQAMDGFPDAATSDLVMDYRNADGSLAEMCGNGIRCLVAYALDRGLTDAEDVHVATRAGAKRVQVLGSGGTRLFRVEMGRASFPGQLGAPGGPSFREEVTLGNGETYIGTTVSMGNPHFVVAVPSYPQHLPDIGAELSAADRFPQGTNVEFVLPVADGAIPARVWERGVGETMACGTGACAIVVAASATDHGPAAATVRFPGGDVDVEVHEDGVFLTGPAIAVFEGAVRL